MASATARLPFTLDLWIEARLLTLFSRRPLEDLLRRATPGTDDYPYALSVDQIVTAVKNSVARPWRMRGRRCLREGLLAFRYLHLAGHRPTLHFGIVPQTAATARPRAHCWVCVDNRIVLNPPEEPMVELFSYDGDRSVPVETSKIAGAEHG